MSAGDVLPWALRLPLRRARNAAAYLRHVTANLPSLVATARTPPRRSELAVSYGYERLPGASDLYGGRVKFALLDRELPNAPRDFNVLYLGSTALPLEAPLLVRLARRRGAAFAWNQNGVAYAGWHGPGWELLNEPRARLLHEADHVFFQSEFCKLSADRFYGERRGRFEVLHNPVDVERFRVDAERPHRPLTLLLGGNQYQRYRLEIALETLALVRRERPETHLVVAGALSFAPDAAAQTRALVERLGIEGAVELVGPYSQEEAPALLRRADILLHTKYADPCPTVVLEAMACGLPVVYSASGGTPELVGAEAGIGIPAPLDWERDHPPAPEDLAAAVLEVAERLPERGAAARERSLRFDARRWAARHREVFERLVAR